jgi:hypothetical protein
VVFAVAISLFIIIFDTSSTNFIIWDIPVIIWDIPVIIWVIPSPGIFVQA